MSLLDGTYEVLRQQPVDETLTRFEATAPDGTLLRIDWYDLAPAQEADFERYRRSLKRLKRSGRTAIYDVTSRPGAQYVAWEKPGDGAQTGRDAEIDALVAAEGFAKDDATVLRDDGRVLLYGLPFGAAAPVATSEPDTDATSDTKQAWWTRLPRPLLSWGVAALLLVASVGGFWIGLERHTNDQIVSVPDVVGQPVNEVARDLYRRGFAVEVSPQSSPEPAGTVLAIDPPPETALRPGRILRLTYALPPGQLPPTEVPRLVGELFPDGVTERLASARLRLGQVARIAADVPQGAVIAQSAPPGAELGEGEPVHVLVSDGPRRAATFLPDLVGLDVEDARYLARVAGIPADRIHVDEVASPGPPGRVLSQSLAPHRAVPRDEAVLRLIVGRGGAAVQAADTTPSLVGLTLEEARSVIGLDAFEVELLATLSLPEGVVDQDPPPGAPRSEPWTLTVNAHPREVPVPEVDAVVRAPEPRNVPFAWTIEPGIPTVTATVYASTLEGETMLVHSQRVAGGEKVDGEWRTTYPGVVTFRLELNGQPYGVPLRVP